ncbi:putative nad dependent epimerase/dehydratase, partial [Fasciola gigantica]
VILTTRNPEIWLTGVRRTILPRKVLAPRPWSFYFIRNIIGLKPLQDMYLNTWRRALGQDVDFTDDTAMLNGFIAWTERVKKTISPKRLLVYDISEGWEPLCQFLQKPVPTEPFPHLNEYKEMRRLFRLERRAGALLQWGLPTLIIFLLAYILYILLR